MRDIRLKNHVLPLSERTLIMGILNVTPDSFSDGGRYRGIKGAVKRAKELAAEGSDIIDIGGESSRPGAKSISPDEEIARVIPVVKALRDEVDIPISIDTSKAEVARQALKEGASIINDITALNGAPEMSQVIGDFDAGVILMHMKGTPENMQNSAIYDNIIKEICIYLQKSINLSLRAGIDPDKIIVDPGIGFGKDLEQNLFIIRNLQEFRKLDKPILVGTSRKSFIGHITGKDVNEREFGTAASVSMATAGGADIIRVHDVGKMKDVIGVTKAIIGV